MINGKRHEKLDGTKCKRGLVRRRRKGDWNYDQVMSGMSMSRHHCGHELYGVLEAAQEVVRGSKYTRKYTHKYTHVPCSMVRAVVGIDSQWMRGAMRMRGRDVARRSTDGFEGFEGFSSLFKSSFEPF